MTDFTQNLEYWMTKMPEKLRSIPIIYLAIPGSHDSMSYGIKPKAAVAPDCVQIVAYIYKILPCVVRRWAITQQLSPLDQLRCGIRYFDLRICLKRTDNKFYFVHGLFCEEITRPLMEIRSFLDEHSGEFVIFDFQHFYHFTDEDFVILAKQIKQIFGSKIYDNQTGDLNTLSLNDAYTKHKQVLVIYRSTKSYVPKEFLPSYMWPTPWPDQINVTKLEKYLDESLKKRPFDLGYVNQCVLTPPVGFIIPRFCSSLRRSCAERVNKHLLNWIKAQQPGPFKQYDRPTSNVFIADFVNLNDNAFAKVVISLNEKLL